MSNLTTLARLNNNALVFATAYQVKVRSLSLSVHPGKQLKIDVQWSSVTACAISNLHSSGTGYYEGLKYWRCELQKLFSDLEKKSAQYMAIQTPQLRNRVLQGLNLALRMNTALWFEMCWFGAATMHVKNQLASQAQAQNAMVFCYRVCHFKPP